MTEDLNEHLVGQTPAEEASCDPRLSRAEFLKKALKPTLVVGALIAAPKIIDKFTLPASAAPLMSLGVKAGHPVGYGVGPVNPFGGGRAGTSGL